MKQYKGSKTIKAMKELTVGNLQLAGLGAGATALGGTFSPFIGQTLNAYGSLQPAIGSIMGTSLLLEQVKHLNPKKK